MILILYKDGAMTEVKEGEYFFTPNWFIVRAKGQNSTFYINKDSIYKIEISPPIPSPTEGI